MRLGCTFLISNRKSLIYYRKRGEKDYLLVQRKQENFAKGFVANVKKM